MRRYARTHGPFTTGELRDRYGVDLDAGADASSSAPATSSAASCARAGREREWCDPEVLRRLRRASLAALRKEIEPADQRALARFLPGWQGVDRHPPAGAGVDRLREVLVAAAGPRAARRGVGARRAAAPRRRVLAGLDGPAVRGGELVWVGAGALGRRSRPRRALLPRGRAAARPAAARQGEPPAEPAPRGDPRAAGGRRVLLHRPARRRRRRPAEELQEALWDLVWAGEVTNDAFAPLRAPRLTLRPCAARARATAGAASRARAHRRAAAGPGPLVADRAAVRGAPSDPAARRRAQAELLLERYGIVTREQVLAEGIPGGFSALYDRSPSSRRSASPAAATSSRASAARSSRCPARSSGCARSATTTRRRRSCSPPPTRRSPTAPSLPLAEARRGRAPGRARPAPTSCSPAPSRCSTSSAAARACSAASRRRPAAASPRSRRWPTPCTAAASSGWRSSASTASRSSAPPGRTLLIELGFRQGPRRADAQRLSDARGRHDPLRREPDPARARGPRPGRARDAAPALRPRPLARAPRRAARCAPSTPTASTCSCASTATSRSTRTCA